MKVKKFPQSCLLFEASKQKILVDPSSLEFEDSFTDEWKTANAVLITHKHGDHIKADTLKNFKVPIYSTIEVANAYPELEIKIVKEGDTFMIGDIKVEVMHAVHGYNPRLKHANAEVFENVGYIIDDGKIRAYATSDTICFNNDYKADYIFAPVTGYGLTMSPFETALFTKEVNAKKLFVVHIDNPTYSRDITEIKTELNKHGINYEIAENGATYNLD